MPKTTKRASAQSTRTGQKPGASQKPQAKKAEGKKAAKKSTGTASAKPTANANAQAKMTHGAAKNGTAIGAAKKSSWPQQGRAHATRDGTGIQLQKKADHPQAASEGKALHSAGASFIHQPHFDTDAKKRLGEMANGKNATLDRATASDVGNAWAAKKTFAAGQSTHAR